MVIKNSTLDNEVRKLSELNMPSFKQKVTDDYYDEKGDATITYTLIEQTASDYSVNVYSNINDELLKTGIDIAENLISLNSANTTVGGDVYIHSGALVNEKTAADTRISAYTLSDISYEGGTITTNPTLLKTFVSGERFEVSSLSACVTNAYGSYSYLTPSDAYTYFYMKRGIDGDPTGISSGSYFNFGATGGPAPGSWYFYTSYTNALPEYKLNSYINGTAHLDSVTELASNGINISDANDYLQFNTANGNFAVETNYETGPTGTKSYGFKLDHGIPETRLLSQIPAYAGPSGILSVPTFNTIFSRGTAGWGSIGSQLRTAVIDGPSITDYKSTVYLSADVDLYIFNTDAETTAANRQTLYIGGDADDTKKGLVNGRKIYVRGYEFLQLDAGSGKIYQKNERLGDLSAGSNTLVIGADNFALTLVYYNGDWFIM